MSFKIVDTEYNLESQGRDPECAGYVEGYTSNTVGHTYLRLNCRELVDQEAYDCHRRSGALNSFNYTVGNHYGSGVRLSRKQVIRLIWELIKWLIRRY